MSARCTLLAKLRLASPTNNDRGDNTSSNTAATDASSTGDNMGGNSTVAARSSRGDSMNGNRVANTVDNNSKDDNKGGKNTGRSNDDSSTTLALPSKNFRP